MDAFLISDTPCATGDIVPVVVVSVLALVDQGETDWKLLTVPLLDAEMHGIRGGSQAVRKTGGGEGDACMCGRGAGSLPHVRLLSV